MAEYKVEVVSGAPQPTLGEGPHWDVETQSLYFIAIFDTESSIMRYDYAENKTYRAKISELL